MRFFVEESQYMCESLLTNVSFLRANCPRLHNLHTQSVILVINIKWISQSIFTFKTCVFIYIFQCRTSRNVYLHMLRTHTDSNVILWNSWSDLYCKLILLKWFYFLKLKLSFKTKFLTTKFSVHFKSGLKNIENILFLIFSMAVAVVL